VSSEPLTPKQIPPLTHTSSENGAYWSVGTTLLYLYLYLYIYAYPYVS